jgi:hypothetical protein
VGWHSSKLAGSKASWLAGQQPGIPEGSQARRLACQQDERQQHGTPGGWQAERPAGSQASRLAESRLVVSGLANLQASRLVCHQPGRLALQQARRPAGWLFSSWQAISLAGQQASRMASHGSGMPAGFQASRPSYSSLVDLQAFQQTSRL